MEEAFVFIKEIGFPIFVAWWLLTRLEKRVDRVMELLTSVITAVAVMAKSLDGVAVNVEKVDGRVGRIGDATGRFPTLGAGEEAKK